MAKTKRFWKEIVSVMAGIALAFLSQLCFFSTGKSGEVMDFILLYLFVVPLIAWTLMGILKVRWIEQWFNITAMFTVGFFKIYFTVMPIIILFAGIAGVVWVVYPEMLEKPAFWVGATAIAAVTAIKLIPKYSSAKPRPRQ